MGGRLTRARSVIARVPLWARLVAATLLLVAVGLTVSGLFGAQMLRADLTRRTDTQLDLLAGRGRVNKLPGRMSPPPAGPEIHRRNPDLIYAVILDPGGKVVQQMGDPISGDRPALPPLTATTLGSYGDEPFTVHSATGSGTDWRVLARQQDDGTIRVVAVSLADVDNVVSSLLAIDAGVGAVVLAVLALVGYALVRASMRPLTDIEDTAETIAGGDLTQRVPETGVPAEVSRLGVALNGMLSQIETAFRDREESAAAARRSEESARRSEDRMRGFIADASHELRTPLTSIRGFAELYRQETGGRADADPEAVKVLGRIEEDAARMGLLVEDLLLLARMDLQRPLDEAPVDLLSLAADAVLDSQALAPDREIDLIRLDETDRPVVVTGDAARLRQVVTNLITNALSHTPPGTPFAVRVGLLDGPDGDRVVLEVADEGPGLDPAQAGRVFERFYRAEPSRARSRGGSGLGLSIVAALVAAHRGTVELETGPGRGACFRVTLPARR